MSWYNTFFHGLPQEAWRAAQTEEQTQLDLELIVDTLSFGPGDQILDIFCGYGRHALPLARMGAQVVGIDIAEDYVGTLRSSAQSEELPLTAYCDDFLTTTALDSYAGSFDAAYCLGNSFCFFPHEDMRRFLQRIADLLSPEGRLLIHSGMVAEVVLPDFQERNWMPVDDQLTVIVENQYDAAEGRIDQQLTYFKTQPDGSTHSEQRTAQYYVYTVAELVRLMQQAGLTVESHFGTVDGQPFLVGDEGVWLVAAKN